MARSESLESEIVLEAGFGPQKNKSTIVQRV